MDCEPGSDSVYTFSLSKMDRLDEIEFSIGYSGHKISFVGKFEQTNMGS